MSLRISRVVLLIAVVFVVVVSGASAHTGEDHPDLTKPEPGPGQVEEPAPEETPDQESKDTEAEKKKAREKSTKKAPTDSEKKEDMADHDKDPAESYKLNTPAQSGYFVALGLVVAVSVLFILAIILL